MRRWWLLFVVPAVGFALLLALVAGAALAPAAPLSFGNTAAAAAYTAAQGYVDQLEAAQALGGQPGATQATAVLAQVKTWDPPSQFASLVAALTTYADDIVAFAPSATLAGDQAALSSDLTALQNEVGPVVVDPGSSVQMDALYYAEQEIGTPYVYGGGGSGGPSTGVSGGGAVGFDCSGLAQWAFAQAGFSLPRGAVEQQAAGPTVPSGSQLVAGDLVFFVGADGTLTSAGHVAIWIGNGWVIDAYETGQPVEYQQFWPNGTNSPVVGTDTAASGVYLGATDPGAA